MELKEEFKPWQLKQLQGLNCTFMELKEKIIVDSEKGVKSLNCTFMELKDIHSTCRK